MKLVHQINLAFLGVLLLVLTGSALVIHYVLLDHFMTAEQNQINSMGVTLTASLKGSPSATVPLVPVQAPIAIQAITQNPFPGVSVVVADDSGQIISGALPHSQDTALSKVSAPAVTEHFSTSPLTPSASALTAPTTDLVKTERQQTALNDIWAGKDSRYLVAKTPIPQGTLTLLSPISRIKGIEWELLKRLLAIICLGGITMFLLSLLITRKLINPLVALKEELKKVKSRRYAEVNRITAGGEIGAVAETVHELAAELERFSRAQKQFFQNASHELKTPLMSISGYAEGIRDGVFEGEQVPKGLAIIMSESNRLKKLVSEMTLLAKLDSEADSFHPAPVQVDSILTEAVERLNPILVKRNLTLNLRYAAGTDSSKLLLHADQDKLLQALLNVLANAARHAVHQIEITVDCKQDMVEITVSDDGAGISAEVLPYLFHRFVKGADGDTGLGLAISRAIVEQSGGSVTAANAEAGGAVVSFRFPVAA